MFPNRFELCLKHSKAEKSVACFCYNIMSYNSLSVVSKHIFLLLKRQYLRHGSKIITSVYIIYIYIYIYRERERERKRERDIERYTHTHIYIYMTSTLVRNRSVAEKI